MQPVPLHASRSVPQSLQIRRGLRRRKYLLVGRRLRSAQSFRERRRRWVRVSCCATKLQPCGVARGALGSGADHSPSATTLQVGMALNFSGPPNDRDVAFDDITLASPVPQSVADCTSD